MVKVAFVRVNHEPNGVNKAVSRALKLSGFNKIKGKRFFIKINAMTDSVVPGVCTSPWVFEALLKNLRKNNPRAEILFGDANVATTKQFNKAVKNWGYEEIGEKYGATPVNLSETKLVTVDLNQEVFKKIRVPEILLNHDIITAPVMKTHCITGFTASHKNQWGCLTTVRHQYHLVANKAIAEINAFLKPVFALIDGTISMEGNGPRNGLLRISDVIIASKDLVAADTVVAKFMGFKLNEVPVIRHAEKLGVGSAKHALVGDEFTPSPYIKPELNKHIVFRTEFFFRKMPLFKWLLFKTPLFKPISWVVTKYNTFIWHHLSGKKQIKRLMRENPFYAEEFKKILKK